RGARTFLPQQAGSGHPAIWLGEEVGVYQSQVNSSPPPRPSPRKRGEGVERGISANSLEKPSPFRGRVGWGLLAEIRREVPPDARQGRLFPRHEGLAGDGLIGLDINPRGIAD